MKHQLGMYFSPILVAYSNMVAQEISQHVLKLSGAVDKFSKYST